MDRKKIEELLDKSCADALDDWARGRVIDRQEALKAMSALSEGLKGYIKPDYDSEYIPPAYVVSYQLGHVYMAWKALSWIADMLEKWSWHSLKIVDLGSGTSAGRIGAALMVAEAIEDNRTFECIYFDEIDISASMQAMGELVWQAFTRRVQREYASTALADAVNVIDPRQHMKWWKVKEDGSETWLTAFHAIYPENRYLKGIINGLYQRFDPIAGAFSCHKGNLEKMREVVPFYSVEGWNLGHFPPREVRDNSKVICETNYTISRALRYGFRQRHERYWNPFLQVKDCAILFGNDL